MNNGIRAIRKYVYNVSKNKKLVIVEEFGGREFSDLIAEYNRIQLTEDPLYQTMILSRDVLDAESTISAFSYEQEDFTLDLNLGVTLNKILNYDVSMPLKDLMLLNPECDAVFRKYPELYEI